MLRGHELPAQPHHLCPNEYLLKHYKLIMSFDCPARDVRPSDLERWVWDGPAILTMWTGKVEYRLIDLFAANSEPICSRNSLEDVITTALSDDGYITPSTASRASRPQPLPLKYWTLWTVWTLCGALFGGRLGIVRDGAARSLVMIAATIGLSHSSSMAYKLQLRASRVILGDRALPVASAGHASPEPRDRIRCARAFVPPSCRPLEADQPAL